MTVAVLAMLTAPPVTTPVAEPIPATVAGLTLQVPGVVASLNVVVRPGQTLSVPLMAAGNGLTVTVAVI